MTNIHAKQGLQTVGGFGVRRPRAGRGPDGGDSKFQIDVVVVRIVVVRIEYNPAPVPGPVVSRRSALEALYSSRVDIDRGHRGAMISSFSSARSCPRDLGHTHRTVRTVFCAVACPHRVSHIMWWESDLAHREMLCCRAFSWRTASADPLSGQK